MCIATDRDAQLARELKAAKRAHNRAKRKAARIEREMRERREAHADLMRDILSTPYAVSYA